MFLGMLLLLSRHFSLTGLSTLQKRRSGRQVKRRKYNEDLDFKVVDDDGETIAVLGAGRTSALSASTLAWQAEVWLWVGVLTVMLPAGLGWFCNPSAPLFHYALVHPP